MTNELLNPEHVERRANTELHGLRNYLMLQQDDVLRRAVTLAIVVGWLGWTYGLGRELLTQGGAVVGGFTIYQLVSLSVLYILFRLNDLDLGKLLGFTPSASEKLDRRERETERRERGGFNYGDDRRERDDEQ